jgi:lysine decarboxylase
MDAGADMLMTTSPNVMIYAALDGWRRQMVQHGHDLLDAALTSAGQVRHDIGALPGLHVLRDEFLGAEASHDLDPLHVVIDISGLDISGYTAANWLREYQRVDMGLSDHRRIEATLSLADDGQSAARLLSALNALTKHASTLPRARQVELPSAAELELEPAMLPRDAFFAAKETVTAQAAGRISAEQITPYPPGIPVIIPGERITAELLDVTLAVSEHATNTIRHGPGAAADAHGGGDAALPCPRRGPEAPLPRAVDPAVHPRVGPVSSG